MVPGIDTSPTTDIMLRLGMSAARTADFMAGKIASVLFAPNASRVSHSCFFSATSASNRSTATAGPDIEFPIIMPAVGTCNMLQCETVPSEFIPGKICCYLILKKLKQMNQCDSLTITLGCHQGSGLKTTIAPNAPITPPPRKTAIKESRK